MDNKLVSEPAFKIREIARQALAGNWQKMFLGVVIYVFLLGGVSSILGYFFNYTEAVRLLTGQYMHVNVPYASGLYEFAVAGPLLYGLSMFTLAFFRSRKIDYGYIFDGFSIFGKTFSLFLLFSLKVFAWSLLFGIPGLIAAFRYSQSFYIQVDHPEWTATQCINESKRLMRGNKGKLFYLELTFFGWYFLASVLSTAVDFIEADGLVSIAFAFIASLPLVVVDLYRNVSTVVFYELLTERLVVTQDSTATY